jgi:hypothetical protein
MRLGNNLHHVKAILPTAALATGLLLFAGAPAAKADGCRERLIKADHKLHEAIEHHGPDSKQAAHYRHELHEAREYCYAHGNRWWDVEGNRWHTDRDWDDHDHDHR